MRMVSGEVQVTAIKELHQECDWCRQSKSGPENNDETAAYRVFVLFLEFPSDIRCALRFSHVNCSIL